MSDGRASPISFEVNVARLPKKGMPVTIEADEAQCVALASVHGLNAVRSLRADMDVAGWKKGGVKVVGRVLARIEQSCIATLEPVDETVDEEFSALFLPEGSRLAVPQRLVEGEMILDAEGEDGPELFSGDTIDVGALAEEFFALGINPYPRKSGAQVEPTDAGQDEYRGPLAEKLAELRKKL